MLLTQSLDTATGRCEFRANPCFFAWAVPTIYDWYFLHVTVGKVLPNRLGTLAELRDMIERTLASRAER
jgi:hypothetical protein